MPTVCTTLGLVASIITAPPPPRCRRPPLHGRKRGRGSMLKPALTLMAGRTLGYAVLFLLPIILVRLFTQEQFGTYKQVFLLYGTILNLAQVGMSESLFYFLPG